MSAFVDTSVCFAAVYKRDAQNQRAKSILRSIDRHLTTDLVLIETWQLLKAKFGKDVAESFWERLRDSGVRVEPVMRADLDAAAEIQVSSPEVVFSFIDRMSFSLMERLGISRAATFNPDFAAYRPRSGRKRPFQIVSEGHSQVFMALRQVILGRRPVHVSNAGQRQTVCPYILGHAAGEERALALLCGAKFEHEASDTSRWICLRLSKVEDVRFADASWVEQDYPGPVQRCVDRVYLDARLLARGVSLG
ncbi:putative nucleic acid-binding protein [Bradyrhizobium sp. RT6a]|uniref:type II toxin-antitoxin system VapC family toxin n=1 Tax=unclassified Bradyrhizobium TaxID=2631580 RepID=UPI003399C860